MTKETKEGRKTENPKPQFVYDFVTYKSRNAQNTLPEGVTAVS